MNLPSNRRRDDWRAQAIELSKLGWGIKRIAKEIGCSPKLVRKARIASGIPTWIGPRGGTEKGGKKPITMRRAVCAMAAIHEEETDTVRSFDNVWGSHPEVGPYMYKANWKRQSIRISADPHLRVVRAARLRVWRVCKMHGSYKTASTKALVGCGHHEFRNHIQKQFKRGMGWHNYGDWEVDHIIPCDSFDLSKPEHQRQCFHFTNLQPLWREENRRKHSTMPTNAQPCLLL